MNKRLAIRWSDRSLLVSSLVSLENVEEQHLSEVQHILDTIAATQPEFYIALNSPSLIFKNQKPVAIQMTMFDQSGVLPKLQKELASAYRDTFGHCEVIEHPSIILGKVKSIKPRQKVKLISGHIDSVFPVTKLFLDELQKTRIGILYNSIHNSDIAHG